MNLDNVYRPGVRGVRTVLVSKELKITFRYQEDFVAPGSQASQSLEERLFQQDRFSLLEGLGMETVLRKRPKPRGCGPHILFVFQCEESVFSFTTGQKKGSRVQVPLKLNSPLKYKKVRLWNERSYKGHFLEWREPDDALVQAVFYEAPLFLPFNTANQRLLGGASSRVVDEHTTAGMTNCSWRPDNCENRVDHRNHPLLFTRIPNSGRFPNAPHNLLTFESATCLKAGDSFGVPLPDDLPLELGYDEQFKQLGFYPDADGYNVVTDYGRFSFPLWPPARTMWLRNPLPEPLQQIEAMECTPAHSWNDVVRGFLGRRLTGIERGAGNDREDSESRPVCHRVSKTSHEQPQPCYKGSSRSLEQIGRYKLFTIDRPCGMVYLVDSEWRDKEVAMRLFQSLHDAREYCRGMRPGKASGRKVHTPGWEAEVEPWIDRCIRERPLQV